MLDKELRDGNISGAKPSIRGLAITHVMYADDIVLFSKATKNDAKRLADCLEKYCTWSGQSINRGKFGIFFSKHTGPNSRRAIRQQFNMKRLKKDAVYLGAPLFLSRSPSKDFKYLQDKLEAKLAGWRSNCLSWAGRCTLINSVTQALPIYTISSFGVLARNCDKLDSLTRRFWWKPKEKEGRNRKLFKQEQADLIKAKHHVHIRFQEISKVFTPTSPLIQRSCSNYWSLPPLDYIKINVDAALNSSKTTLAVVAQNHLGESKEIEEESEEESIESLTRDEDFEIFYHWDVTEDIISTSKMATVAVSEDQEATEVPKAMVIEKKLPDLLSLLKSHAGGAKLEVPMMPRPPTPVPLPPAQTNPADKKRKRDKKGGKSSVEEGEIPKDTPPEQTKVAKITRAQQRKGGDLRDGSGMSRTSSELEPPLSIG
nr:hypothetical protein CFP56_10907 [Quercus suber]